MPVVELQILARSGNYVKWLQLNIDHFCFLQKKTGYLDEMLQLRYEILVLFERARSFGEKMDHTFILNLASLLILLLKFIS
jgi:hypothetical protein